ncbi:MAG TPA: hypothetical protein PLP17_03520, partial [Oligoflexia bacterium]|nr:hypothetical protein [Oligoflexia bacterium]
ISLKVPMLGERYLAVSFPFFVILIAYGLQTPTVKRLAVTMLFVVCFLWCFSLHEYYFSPQFGKTQWRKAANIVKTQGQPTQVVVHPGFIDILLRFYLPEKYSISDARDVLPSLPNAGDCRSSPVASEGFWLIERGSVPTLIPQLTSKGYQPAIEQLLPLENGIRLLMFPCLPSSGTVFGNE